jgi:hypothetical protein
VWAGLPRVEGDHDLLVAEPPCHLAVPRVAPQPCATCSWSASPVLALGAAPVTDLADVAEDVGPDLDDVAELPGPSGTPGEGRGQGPPERDEVPTPTPEPLPDLDEIDPVRYDRDEAIVEHAQVTTRNGIDQMWVDIVRPDTDEPVPTILIASPYYNTLGRGWKGELKTSHQGPENPGASVGAMLGGGSTFVEFPEWYDEYFVERGYAVALMDLRGTRNSSGCMQYGDRAEVFDTVDVIDWIADQELVQRQGRHDRRLLRRHDRDRRGRRAADVGPPPRRAGGDHPAAGDQPLVRLPLLQRRAVAGPRADPGAVHRRAGRRGHAELGHRRRALPAAGGRAQGLHPHLRDVDQRRLRLAVPGRPRRLLAAARLRALRTRGSGRRRSSSPGCSTSTSRTTTPTTCGRRCPRTCPSSCGG